LVPCRQRVFTFGLSIEPAGNDDKIKLLLPLDDPL
jgi:hypothetical protein